jgi:iron complex outermembrane recepter protein
MFVQSTLRRAVRLALFAGGATAALVAGTATAQDQDQDQSLEDVQTVVVTGSRIQRPELEAPVPTLVLGQEAFEAQGLENIADLAVTLPQFAPSFGTSRTQSTFSGAASSGLNNANLRNLGGTRSVVLVNGRRVPGGSSTSTSVDFNTLPTANIERIELLTGGAAAIYGADAVAGVINIITKKDFEGIEIGASYGTTAESDNENPSAHLMFGGSFGDRGRGLITLQYDKQGLVSCADRFLCAEDFVWNTTTPPTRGPAAYSGVGLAPRVFIPGFAPSDPRSAGFTSRNGSFTDANGNLMIFSIPVDGYNRNADRDIAIPTTRVMFAAEGDFQLAESVTAFVEMNYGQSDTDSQFEGHPFQSAQAGSLVGGGPGVAGLQASIPLNNPFVPAAFLNAYLAQNPTADPSTAQIDWFQRFNFFGFRGADNHRETVRGVLGLRGEIPSLGFAEGWQWELSHVYGRTAVDSNTEGFVGTDRLYNGLRVEPVPGIPGQFRCIDAAARALGCVPINPFGGYTQEMIDYLTVSAGQKGASELEDTLAYISGSVFELPAGPVQAAIGLERRVFSGYLDYDEIVQQGLVSGNQILDTPEAEIETNEVYIETLVPLLREAPFAHSLSIEGAFRKSESEYFSTSVDYDTWKYGGEWAPLEGLRFRAMRARSVRAPLPFELGGGGQTFGNINDPCFAGNQTNPTRVANCLADGVPPNYSPPLIVQQGVAGFQVGNDDLVPEEATSLTYGLVLNPTFLRDFSLTVDRFQLEVEGFINTFGRQSIANACYDTPDRQFCELIQRGTHPAVSGATWVLNGIDDTVGNLSTYDIRGYDVEARYGFDLSRAFGADSHLGKIGLQALMTFYDTAEQVARPGAATVDLLGFAGGSTSDQGYLKRQGVFNVDYRRNNVSASWQTRYIGRTGMTPLQPTAFPEVGSHVYHNMRASLGFGESSEVYLGVTNVFDKQPPFFASSTSGTQALDTIPGFYDVFGRSYYGGVRVKF